MLRINGSSCGTEARRRRKYSAACRPQVVRQLNGRSFSHSASGSNQTAAPPSKRRSNCCVPRPRVLICRFRPGAGRAIEAQGRTSGSFAFVRFIELSGERAALANLETEHTRLLATFDNIQALFDRLSMPVWLSRKDGSLYWTNKAYADAVEAKDSVAAVQNNVQLLDSSERKEMRTSQDKNGYYCGTLPAVVAGDRRVLEVVEVETAVGSAALAVDRNDVEEIRATLKRTMESHANTLDQLATAVAIFDASKNLQFYNSSFQKLWNLETGFLESLPSNSAILDAMRDNKKLPSQPDWRKWREGQLEVYQALEPREEWWHLPDGQTLRVVVNPQAQGGVTWIFEDVTEELELKSSYNSLVRVQGETLDHLSEAVVVFGSDGKLRLANPALAAIFRLEPSQIEVGTHVTPSRKTGRRTFGGSGCLECYRFSHYRI